MNDILQRTRAAIFEVFGEVICPNDPEHARKEIERATRLGDPGRDGKGVAAVVGTANLLGIVEGVAEIEGWATVSKLLGDHFMQTVNAEKAHVYRVV